MCSAKSREAFKLTVRYTNTKLIVFSFALLVTAIAIVTHQPQGTVAECGCLLGHDFRDDPAAAFDAADYVFSGTATKLIPAGRRWECSGRELYTVEVSSHFYFSTQFEVDSVWKGDVPETFFLDHGSCKYEFQENQHYVVYAYKSGILPHTDFCAGTRRTANAQDIIKFLPAPTKPPPNSIANTPTPVPPEPTCPAPSQTTEPSRTSETDPAPRSPQTPKGSCNPFR